MSSYDGADKRVQIRQMTEEDIPAGGRLCRASGWNQIESDWRLFLEQNAEGCLVAEIDGEVAGTVATLPYQNRFTWLAMVLVEPSKRRNGIGTKLLEQALGRSGDNTCVRLDATAAGRQIYPRYGFHDEYPISRMVCARPHTALHRQRADARPVRSEDLPRILELDREVFGADREPVLRSLQARAPEYAWLIADSHIKGYCFGRDGFDYQQIGPVVATDEHVAQALVSCCLRADTKPHLIDVPEHSTAWLDWLHLIGFLKERSFTRMFRGESKYPGDPKRVFAAAGPELG